jgi:hypothetical protein
MNELQLLLIISHKFKMPGSAQHNAMASSTVHLCQCVLFQSNNNTADLDRGLLTQYGGGED